MVKLKVKAPTNGQMDASTLDSGRGQFKKVKQHLRGLMVEYTEVNTKGVKLMVKGA